MMPASRLWAQLPAKLPRAGRATAGRSQLTVLGSLNSTASTSFRIDVYANDITVGQDSTGYGEGQTYLGYVNVTPDRSGKIGRSTIKRHHGHEYTDASGNTSLPSHSTPR